ncbi:monoglyceride lipase [Anaeramoeba flamelloides]|uniref:Monoglyceride lipase n=1 Tax=Anaeramoeba flamelloides TaxID=1746091 RepID=A0AAV7YUF8_9EUKA|nr:monoglyceride lipase [Anaeramoeba flamelloides]
MITNKFDLQTFDGLTLKAVSFQPEDKETITGVLFIIHGFAEHSMRYQDMAKQMTDAGIAVVSMDQRGHGKSEGKQGHTPSMEAWIKDVHMMVHRGAKIFNVKKKGLPVYMFGHSMGGGILFQYLIQYRPVYVRAAIASSPFLRLTKGSVGAVRLSLAKMMHKIHPGYTQSSDLDSNLLTDDPKLNKKYDDDPLTFKKITVGNLISVLNGGVDTLENAQVLTEFEDFKLLFVIGKGDKLVDWEAVVEVYEKIQDSKKIDLYLDKLSKHDLHHCSKKEEVIAMYINYLKTGELTGQPERNIEDEEEEEKEEKKKKDKEEKEEEEEEEESDSNSGEDEKEKEKKEEEEEEEEEKEKEKEEEKEEEEEEEEEEKEEK